MTTAEELNRRFPIPEPRSEVEALEMKLSRAASNWRATKDAKYVKEYHDIYHDLCSLDWDGAIDVESELPSDLMPKHYFEQLHATTR
jgi:hypothetical protein